MLDQIIVMQVSSLESSPKSRIAISDSQVRQASQKCLVSSLKLVQMCPQNKTNYEYSYAFTPFLELIF